LLFQKLPNHAQIWSSAIPLLETCTSPPQHTLFSGPDLGLINFQTKKPRGLCSTRWHAKNAAAAVVPALLPLLLLSAPSRLVFGDIFSNFLYYTKLWRGLLLQIWPNSK
jgi:hypothetical protein